MFVSPTIRAVQIISFNVNGIRNSDGRSGLLLWLRSLAVVPDVVCLQEAHCVSDVECQSWFRCSCFQSVVSPGSQKSCGCVILFRPSLSLVDFSSDDAGRVVSCKFCLQDKLFQTSFLSRSPPGLTHWSLLSCVVTSIRYLTASSIVLGRMLLIPRERVPLRFRICLMRVVLSTPGVTFILHPRVLPG